VLSDIIQPFPSLSQVFAAALKLLEAKLPELSPPRFLERSADDAVPEHPHPV